ncbi:MAG: Tryptophan synthase alpha chain [Labilithrix sp.]|nr:Tryptophan synthase alpha chain [Labilithrix sp.]
MIRSSNTSRLAALGAIALVSLAVTGACGSDRNGFDPTTGAGNGNGASSSGSSGDFGQGDASADATVTPTRLGWVSGKVTAPEGTVPIRGALVYLTSTPPPAIPESVHCDTCVKLTPYDGYAYSKSDGTFELPVYTTGKQWIVTQKGQFRRVREFDAQAGDQTVDGAITRLPPQNDAATGDTIPRIAMAVGGYDHIDKSLKKLGVTEFYRYGDGPINIGGPPPGIKTGKTSQALTQDVAELSKYHIVLMPCAALGYSQNDNGPFICGVPQAAQKTAFGQYVDAGGKLYVTDFAYEAIRQTWPNLITWYDDTMQPLNGTSSGHGRGCRGGAETNPGEAKDQGLAEWLTTIGHPSLELKASWTRIQKVDPQPGVDPDGNPTTITPKVWMTSKINAGTELPATVSFEQKCGRVLFSTYHCEGDDGSQLLAQEKALLYILLEVGVCVGEMPPPPPPK